MKSLFSGLRMVVVMTLLAGLLYTTAMTLLANTVFYEQSTGSIVRVQGKAVGSRLLAQQCTGAQYFRARPSAGNYATVASGASNLGPASEALKSAVQQRRDTLEHLYGSAHIPGDLLFASGSGLDPHISPEAARVQIQSIARTRRLTPGQAIALARLVEQHVEQPQFGFLGQPRVNVLLLNIALDSTQL